MSLDTAHPSVVQSTLPTRADVRAFIKGRMQERDLRPADVARLLGCLSAGQVSHLFNGRHLFSTSRHFERLCELLNLTPEECEFVRGTEQQYTRPTFKSGESVQRPTENVHGKASRRRPGNNNAAP